MQQIDTFKIIGRTSKNGKVYFQTCLNIEGQDKGIFIPVFLKKKLEKFDYVSKENKVDSRGEIYTLYEVPARNVFMPKNEDGIKKAIILK